MEWGQGLDRNLTRPAPPTLHKEADAGLIQQQSSNLVSLRREAQRATLDKSELMEVEIPGVPVQAHDSFHRVCHYQEPGSSSSAPLLAYKSRNVPSDPSKSRLPRADLPSRKVSLEWQKQADKHVPYSVAQGRQRLHKATVSQEWCPRSPLSVWQSMWASQGLPVVVCRCFSQDTSRLTQIIAQGHENKDHFLLWEVSTSKGEKEQLMEHGKDRTGM